MTISGAGALGGYLIAPTSTVVITGTAQIKGGLIADRVKLDGGVSVQLVDMLPSVALTTPANGAVLRAPATFSIAASASDIDGAVAKVEFFNGATKLGDAIGAPFQVTWSNVPAGSYVLAAKATDNAGGDTTSASRTIIVDAPPTASVTAPPKVARGAAVVLSASATDSDGTIAKVEFYRENTLVGTITAPSGSPPVYAFSDAAALPPGTYNYHSRSYDNAGFFTDSDPIRVFVLPTLPYTADFETAEGYTLGPLGNQLGWTGDSAVAVTDQAAFSGTRSMVLPPSVPPVQILQGFAPLAGHSIIFVDFFARPVAETDVNNATTFDVESARFAFVRNGTGAVLTALDGDGQGGGAWRATKFTTALGSDDQAQTWIRLSARMDFDRKAWDLYANGNMVAADLRFRDSTAPCLSSFAVRGNPSAASRVDYLFAGAENPLFADTNNDGIDEAWETKYGLSLATNDRNLSPSGNGVPVVQCYINGTDPTDYYQGVPPVITSVSGGNGQSGPQSLLSVRLTNAAGAILSNAPVTISTTGAAAKIASTAGGPSSTSLKLRTDAQGLASVYLTFNAYKPETVTFAGGSRSVSLTIQPPSTDSDNNGLPDLWETTYFGRLGIDSSADPDGDGKTNLQEFQNGTDPTDYYNGVLPQLTSQVAADGSLAADGSISLKVTNVSGVALGNAPVTFRAEQGGHRLAASPGGPPVTQATVRTDANGIARIYILPGSN